MEVEMAEVAPVATPATTIDTVKPRPAPSLPLRETRQTVVKPSPEPVPIVAPVLQEPPPPRLPAFNPFLHTLDMLEFPADDWRDRIQPDDLNDTVLMLCARALATCGNRALCPKEIAEVMMYRGWTCKYASKSCSPTRVD
jgi:hypothetical protein